MDQNKTKIVVTGDSIMEDLTVRAFTSAANMAGIDASFFPTNEGKYIELANTAMGGHTIDMIAQRFHHDAVLLNPDIVIVNGGTNDLWGWGTSESSFELSWQFILDQCKDNNILAVAVNIVPASGFPNDIMIKRDQWNSALKTLVSRYDGFIYADSDNHVGFNRAEGDKGNLWDIRPEYDMDGVHYTSRGSDKIAQAVLESMRDVIL